jgi:hypothetical protein
MAIDEFTCTARGERFEISKPMSQHHELEHHAAPPCPKCGETTTRLLPSLLGDMTLSSA